MKPSESVFGGFRETPKRTVGASRPTAGLDGLDLLKLSIVAPPPAICNDRSFRLALMIHGRPKSHRDAKGRRVAHSHVSQMAPSRALA
jgi:hypothetical protein